MVSCLVRVFSADYPKSDECCHEKGEDGHELVDNSGLKKPSYTSDRGEVEGHGMPPVVERHEVWA